MDDLAIAEYIFDMGTLALKLIAVGGGAILVLNFWRHKP